MRPADPPDCQPDNDYRKLKNALGMSSRSIVHHWKKAGVPGQLPGYATHLGKVARASRYMKAGGYIGVLIGGVSGYLSTQQVCSDNPDSVACERVRFVERRQVFARDSGWLTGSLRGCPLDFVDMHGSRYHYSHWRDRMRCGS